MKRVYVLMLAAVVASCACASLTENSDFDNGSSGWGYTSAWGSYFYTDGSDTILSMGGWGNGTSNDWSNTSVYQQTSSVFQADTVYQLQVVWREPSGEPATESLMLVIQDTTSSSEWVDVAYDWYTTSLGGEWNSSVLTFDTADDPSVIGQTIGVGVRLTSSTGTWVHIDSVTLVPEPMTILLLAVGSVVSLRRK